MTDTDNRYSFKGWDWAELADHLRIPLQDPDDEHDVRDLVAFIRTRGEQKEFCHILRQIVAEDMRRRNMGKRPCEV